MKTVRFSLPGRPWSLRGDALGDEMWLAVLIPYVGDRYFQVIHV